MVHATPHKAIELAQQYIRLHLSEKITMSDLRNASGYSERSLQLLFKTHPAPADRMAKLTTLLSPELEAAAVVSAASNRISTAGK